MPNEKQNKIQLKDFCTVYDNSDMCNNSENAEETKNHITIHTTNGFIIKMFARDLVKYLEQELT